MVGGDVMEKKYQAFISSTYEDLKVERQAVIGALLENGFIPTGMEQFPASPMSQWDFITKMIDSSDYYILIVAGRYGSIDPQSGVSYTEKEYLYAIEKGLPVLAFLHSDVGSIQSSKCEGTDDGKKKLEAFRETIKNGGRLIKYFNGVDDLKGKVTTAVINVVKDCPRPGWIRADFAEDHEEYSTQREIESLRHELEELREVQTWGEIGSLQTQQTDNFSALSNDASVLLVYAADGSHGEIIVSKTLSGTSISAGKWNFTENGGTREEERWIEAINELIRKSYIRAEGSKGTLYRVTHKGYELSEKIVFDCKVDTNNNPGQYLYD